MRTWLIIGLISSLFAGLYAQSSVGQVVTEQATSFIETLDSDQRIALVGFKEEERRGVRGFMQ